jgi:KUP system potassium uptake protein
MITPGDLGPVGGRGVSLVTLAFDRFTIPVTLLIVAGLFFLSAGDTGGVGSSAGQVVWFQLAVLGAIPWRRLAILRALQPAYARASSPHGSALIVLGSIFLAVTGPSALRRSRAFGRAHPLPGFLSSARRSRSTYLGRAPWCSHPERGKPLSWRPPRCSALVILATLAPSSRARPVISGAFSMVKPAVRMGSCRGSRSCTPPSRRKGRSICPR